jgi:hypothetical protein
LRVRKRAPRMVLFYLITIFERAVAEIKGYERSRRDRDRRRTNHERKLKTIVIVEPAFVTLLHSTTAVHEAHDSTFRRISSRMSSMIMIE